jgi:hypothetical protein
MLNLGNGSLYLATGFIPIISRGHYTCVIYFPVLFLYNFGTIKIDSAVVCLSFAVNMARCGDKTATNLPTFFSFMFRMRCYIQHILLSSSYGTVFR